jgi:hypothetical protein
MIASTSRICCADVFSILEGDRRAGLDTLGRSW